MVRIEGSASAFTSRADKTNQQLAHDRVMNVYLRLVDLLSDEGLVKGVDYAIEMVTRVQPDSDTPEKHRNSEVAPESFQYVRIDIR